MVLVYGIFSQTHLRIFCESLKRSAVLVVGESANEDGKGNTFIHCDLCQDKESWSVRFCADCNKRLCADHLKVMILVKGKECQTFLLMYINWWLRFSCKCIQN